MKKSTYDHDTDLVTVCRTGKAWLTKDKTHYRLEVYNSRLANVVNKLIGGYDGYFFRTGEEAVFKILHSNNSCVTGLFSTIAEWG